MMAVKRPGERKSLSRSATRALDVLEYFGHVRRPLRAIEIARRFGLHPSTANQLLKTMLESAHLTFDSDTKTYMPSPRLTQFSSWMMGLYGGDERLRRLVRDVHASAGEVVTLTTPNALFMQIIDLAGVDFSVNEGEGAERGLKAPMFGSAIGAAYLSTLPDMEIQRLADRARLSPAGLAAIMKWVTRARKDGMADGAAPYGSIWSIAVPLPADSFTVPLVLGLAGPGERVRGKLPQLGTLLRTTIARIVTGADMAAPSATTPMEARSR